MGDKGKNDKDKDRKQKTIKKDKKLKNALEKQPKRTP